MTETAHKRMEYTLCKYADRAINKEIEERMKEQLANSILPLIEFEKWVAVRLYKETIYEDENQITYQMDCEMKPIEEQNVMFVKYDLPAFFIPQHGIFRRLRACWKFLIEK